MTPWSSGLLRSRPVQRVEHCTAAGGNDHIRQSRQMLDCLDFALAESGFAFDFEDHRDLHAGASLDFVVAVMEIPPQTPRKSAPDGGLAGTHQPHEKHV